MFPAGTAPGTTRKTAAICCNLAAASCNSASMQGMHLLAALDSNTRCGDAAHFGVQVLTGRLVEGQLGVLVLPVKLHEQQEAAVQRVWMLHGRRG
jgi:hypothetical protein